MNMPASITLARAVALALVVVPGAALASQFDYSLYAGVEHSNNITLATNNPISQNEFIPGLDFTYSQLGSVFQVNAFGTLEYHDFLGNKFDNQTQTQLAGQANWTVLPGRLDFGVEDYAGVQPVDSLASDSPDNEQQTNVLTIGPTLHLQFGQATRGQVELRYINSYASKVDDFNSSRGVAAFRLFRDISPTDQVSLNAETQHVDFDNATAAGPNYDRNELFARYTTKLAKFDADVSVGWSQLSFSHQGSTSKPLIRVTLGWEPTARSTFSLSGDYQYADAAQDLSQPMGPATINASGVGIDNGEGISPQNAFNTGSGISTGSVVIDSQVYLERLAQAIYTFRSERLTLTVTPLYSKLSYLNDPTFNQTGRGASISLEYRLQPTLTLSVFGSGDRLTYETLDRVDKTYRFGVDLSRRFSSHWSAHVSFARQLRNSDAVAQSYKENEIFFGVVYRR
jgi:hypothetical protein